MASELLEQVNHRLVVTRKLCAMTLDLAKEGREAIKATREKVARTHRILNRAGKESSAPEIAHTFGRSLSMQAPTRDLTPLTM